MLPRENTGRQNKFTMPKAAPKARPVARPQPESQRTQRSIPATAAPKPAAHLAPDQAHNLRVILHVARYLHSPKKSTKAAVETGLVESHLHNLGYGDRDSVGVFQQRPSQGWTGLTNVQRAATEFLKQANAQAPQYKTSGDLAQSVQRSGYPERYKAHSKEAERLLGAYVRHMKKVTG